MRRGTRIAKAEAGAWRCTFIVDTSQSVGVPIPEY
jgi:hypothetical protein